MKISLSHAPGRTPHAPLTLPQASVPQKRLELLQSCRGIAALLVLLFHVTQLSREKLGQTFLYGLFQFGDSGVNFFFVLSGFIVFWVHRFDRGQSDRLKPFILKRLVRVYPLYWIITLLLVPVYVLIPSFGQGYENHLAVIFKSLLLLPQTHPPILTVGWSLSYEILFYLVFSLTILLKPKLSGRIISVWLLGTIFIQCLNITGNSFIEQNLLIQFVFSFHNLEFALGCLSAYLISQSAIREGLFLLVLGVSLFAFYGMHQPEQATLERVIFYGVPSMLIVLGAASLDLKRSFKLPRIFPYLGDASYSIYLTHYPYLSAAIKLALTINMVDRLGYFPTIGLLIASAIVVGCLTYSLIEKPLLTFLRQKLVANLSSSSAIPSHHAMKILFLDQSGKLGGAELCLLDIAKFYRDRALVCLFTDGLFRTELEAQQVPVCLLATESLQVRKDSGFVKGLQSLGQLLPLVSQVVRLSRDYDLIYANTQKALVVGALASLMSRRPLVYHLHDILSLDHFSSTNQRLAVTLANRFAKRVIATSHAAQKAFIEAGGRPEITTVLYNGFDPKAYLANYADANQIRQQLGLEGRFVVGHFSRLSPWKGQHVLLEALASSPAKVTALFVGDALYGEQEYVRQLHAQVAELGLQDRVRFLGFRSDVVSLMTACDLIAHTSTTPEPFGRVIVEAMLCGRPAVATEGGGVMEIIEPEVNGWLVPPEDPKSLAAVITHCHDQPAAALAIVRTAQADASQRFHLKKTHQQLDQLLHRLIAVPPVQNSKLQTGKSL
jgi:peptidoglycan/LPS O-acetylase OafA/YrhL/glycosyltransferase involved in cell wall biosynthesis